MKAQSFHSFFYFPKKLKSRSGFTLVELLIVVAIVGILSTIGIPTFKRMVQKAKKSEAKVALGGLYTSEAAFFAEYGGYGSNLDKIGLELEGNQQIYSIGFPAGGACATVGAHKPLVATSIGTAINVAFPAFYTAPSATNDRKVFVRTGQTNCETSTLPDDGSSFTATASGPIAPGVAVTAALTEFDVWTMNEDRTLINTRDGVK